MRRTLISMGAVSALFLSALLHAAAPASVVEAAMQGNRDAVRTLLKEGADVNTAQADGMTALHWAAQKGDVELAKMLLYAGANVRATTRIGGYTPLLIASRNGHAAMIETLIGRRRRSQRGDEQRHDAVDAGRAGRQRRGRQGADRPRRRRQREGKGQRRNGADVRRRLRPRRRHPRADRARRRRDGHHQGASTSPCSTRKSGSGSRSSSSSRRRRPRPRRPRQAGAAPDATARLQPERQAGDRASVQLHRARRLLGRHGADAFRGARRAASTRSRRWSRRGPTSTS